MITKEDMKRVMKLELDDGWYTTFTISSLQYIDERVKSWCQDGLNQNRLVNARAYIPHNIQITRQKR